MSEQMTRQPRRANPPIALIGAPTDIGAGHRGSSMGPEALRVAGIEAALSRLGCAIEDRGNIAGPVNPDAAPVNGYRHLEETTIWCQAVRDAVDDALRRGFLPILLGGDHSLSIGSIAAVARHCAAMQRPLSVLWLDAHADFNTPDTSPSGNIHGMPVAVIAGHGPGRLTGLGNQVPMVDPSRIIQLGVRSIDATEKHNVVRSGMAVYDMRRIDENGMRWAMKEILDRLSALGGHVHVSLDVDFLDPSIAPGVATTVSGGPTYREAQLCMEMIYDSGLVGSLDIMELNPAFDLRNRTAELIVELVQSLFGEQILSRHGVDL
ncbi:MAG: arginase [Gammaproteobacteria bacterium]